MEKRNKMMSSLSLGGLIDYAAKENCEAVPRISSTHQSHECPDCFKSFPSPHSLVAHRRVHSNKTKNKNASTTASTSADGRNIWICEGCKKEHKYYKASINHKTKCKKYASWKK